MAKARKGRKSAGCKCKTGVDGRKHCWRRVGRKIRGCKVR